MEKPIVLADLPVAKFLSEKINLQVSKGKTQRQIALDAGYDQPNMISMFKSGTAKVPISKIPALSRALDIDIAELFNLVIEQDHPGSAKVVAEIFGAVLTRDEAATLNIIRSVANNCNLSATPDLKTKIDGLSAEGH